MLRGCSTLSTTDSESPHPRGFAQGIGWYNQTSTMGTGPSTIFGAVGFDPLLGGLGGELVYFGGCLLPPSPCGSNVTWIYNGVAWSPTSSSTLPPALFGAGMDFDPSLGGVVLFGGSNPSHGSSNQTWLYTNSGWSNLSGTAWGQNAPLSTFGTLVWDPAQMGLLLVDGCSGAAGCTSYADGTWLMNSSGWHRLGNGPGSPRSIAYASMAWDRTDRLMVLFGGNDSGRRLLNETWLYNGTTWSNATHIVPGCTLNCVYPTARQASLMTWDGQLGTVMLFAGMNSTSNHVYNDTWVFTRSGGWSPYGALAGLAGPTANTYGAMSVNSTGTAPLLVSGECALYPFGNCLGTDWTLDNPASLTPTVGPLPCDAGIPVTLRANVSAATGSGPWESWLLTYGDGSFSNGHAIGLPPTVGWSFSGSHSYATGGSFNLSYSVSDFFQVTVQVLGAVVIGSTLLLNATAAPIATVAGFPVTFAMNASGGTPPYRYVWSFGDGGVALTANASHSYLLGMTYQVSATVMDRGRGSVVAPLSLAVSPPLSASFQALLNPIDVGVQESFVGSATGGMGGPYLFTWMFGDGTIGIGSAASHTFTQLGSSIVRMNASDVQGYGTSMSQTLVVNPVLSTSASAILTSANLKVALYQFSAVPSGGTPPYAFSWRFGDGGANQNASPTHLYTRSGAFTVSLWVNDSGGGSLLQHLTIDVANTQGALPSSSPSPWTNPWLWAGIIAAAVVVGILLSWRLGQRGKPKAPSSPRGPSASGSKSEMNAGSPTVPVESPPKPG